MAETRPVRPCDYCGGVDDHPRHVHGVADGDSPTSKEVFEKALANAKPENAYEVLRWLADDSTQIRHLDCCREAGCPDNTCAQVTAGAEDLRGDDLVAHLTKGN